MNQLHILVIEDDEDDQLFLRQAIDDQIENAVIHEAYSGEEALSYLEKPNKELGLILLDMHMLGLSGLDVLEKIRSQDDLRHIPIVILSTNDPISQVEEAYRKGANSYISKPRSYSGYEEVVRAIKICFLDRL